MIKDLIDLALKEDCPDVDLTSRYFVPENGPGTAAIIAKESGIFFGSDVLHTLFKDTHLFKSDGSEVTPGDKICEIRDSAHNLLLGERVLLNLVQHLSGISTLTSQFVQRLNNPNIKILDTRKTTPLWRSLEKQAVVAGGGHNHRHSLSDMVLIKENHLTAFLKTHTASELPKFFQKFKLEHPTIPIEIEIESMQQLDEFDLRLVDYILLDNFALAEISAAIEKCKKYSAEIEISGNITLDNIHHYSHLEIHRISVGQLTHSARALDLSMVFTL